MLSAELLTSSISTPIGPFSFTVAQGKVIEATFGQPRSLQTRGRVVRTLPIVSASLRAYFAGDLKSIERIPVAIDGTPFQKGVLRKMRGIKAGKTLSYQALAVKAGSPRASRAVGSACATNSIPLIIPCHRVLPSDGSIGRYGYGERKKAWLLEFEGAITRA